MSPKLDISEKLKTYRAFKGVEDRTIEDLASSSSLITIEPYGKKPATLYHQEDSIDTVHFLLKGKVSEVSSHPNGDPTLIDLVYGSGFVGPLDYIDGTKNHRTDSAMVNRKSDLLGIPYGEFELLRKNSKFKDNLIGILKETLEFSILLRQLKNYPLNEAIPLFLEAAVRRFSLSASENEIAKLDITNYEIGNLLTVDPASLSRKMRGLREKGIVTRGNNNLHIDMGKLQEII